MSDKETTVKLIEEEYQKLRKVIDDLDNEQLCRVWFGTWAVRDIVAHVLGWEREMTGALQRMAQGERPAPEGVDWSKFDEWNAKFASAMESIGPGTVLAYWRQAHMNFVRAAKALPDDRFGDGKTANRLLETTGFGHYRMHGSDIRKWREQEGL